MISIMELMEKKTPLIKNRDKKKGMTLVEIMAAMAIFSILFVAISSLMVNTAKIESKSNTLLDNTTIVKSVLTVFEVNGDGDGTGEYISNERFEELKISSNSNPDKLIEIEFNTINNMQKQLISGDNSDGNNYTAKIKIEKVAGKKLYLINVNLKNNIKNEFVEKKMFINRN